MEPEQYENLALLAEAIAIDGEENEDIEQDEKDIKDAREIARAMRAPITDAALRKSGWKHKSTDDEIFQVDEFKMGGVTVRIGGGYVIVGVAGRRFDGVTTFYDLGELMRLLGGQP